MAGIGDMGPEAVYCFHMEPTCVSHLPQDFFLLCTLTVPLRHHRSTSTALLSFVRKTNHQLHYIVFSMCFSSINGLQSFVTNGCKSAFDAYKGKAAAKPKCRVPIRCVYHLLRDGCGSSMIHRASFDYPLRFIMRRWDLCNASDTLARSMCKLWHQWDIFYSVERLSASLKTSSRFLCALHWQGHIIHMRTCVHSNTPQSNHHRAHLLHDEPSVRPSRNIFGWHCFILKLEGDKWMKLFSQGHVPLTHVRLVGLQVNSRLNPGHLVSWWWFVLLQII